MISEGDAPVSSLYARCVVRRSAGDRKAEWGSWRPSRQTGYICRNLVIGCHVSIGLSCPVYGPVDRNRCIPMNDMFSGNWHDMLGRIGCDLSRQLMSQIAIDKEEHTRSPIRPA